MTTAAAKIAKSTMRGAATQTVMIVATAQAMSQLRLNEKVAAREITYGRAMPTPRSTRGPSA